MLVVCLGIALEDACLPLGHFSKYSNSVNPFNRLVPALSQTVTAISSVFLFCFLMRLPAASPEKFGILQGVSVRLQKHSGQGWVPTCGSQSRGFPVGS